METGSWGSSIVRTPEPLEDDDAELAVELEDEIIEDREEDEEVVCAEVLLEVLVEVDEVVVVFEESNRAIPPPATMITITITATIIIDRETPLLNCFIIQSKALVWVYLFFN